MATNRNLRFKTSRRFGVNVYGHPKALKRQPAEARQKKMSEYGIQLAEKQKVKAVYTTIEELEKIGIIVINLKLEPQIEAISHSLLNLWILVYNHHNHKIKPKITECFINFAQKLSIEEIYLNNVGNDIATFGSRVVERIIGNSNIDSDLEKDALIVVNMLGNIGIKATDKSTNYAISIIKALERMGSLSAGFKYKAKTKEEKIVLNEIEETCLLELNKMKQSALLNNKEVGETTTNAIIKIVETDKKQPKNS